MKTFATRHGFRTPTIPSSERDSTSWHDSRLAWSDDKILEYAFEADILYWTEWEDFDDDDYCGPEKTETSNN